MSVFKGPVCLTVRFPKGAKVPQRLRKHPQERTEEGQEIQMMCWDLGILRSEVGSQDSRSVEQVIMDNSRSPVRVRRPWRQKSLSGREAG